MITIITLFLTIVSVLLFFSFSLRFSYRGQLSDTVCLAEMERCERDNQDELEDFLKDFRITSTNGDTLYLDTVKLAEALNLQIKPSEDLPDKYRGSLNEPTDDRYNGLIKHVKDADQYSVYFDIMHEIIHYWYDVGRGNRVSQSFARLHHGNTRGHREQIIDYYAAAAAIPKTDLQERLRRHAGNPFDDQFVKELVSTYRLPKDTVVRRIGEVLALA